MGLDVPGGDLLPQGPGVRGRRCRAQGLGELVGDRAVQAADRGVVDSRWRVPPGRPVVAVAVAVTGRSAVPGEAVAGRRSLAGEAVAGTSAGRESAVASEGAVTAGGVAAIGGGPVAGRRVAGRRVAVPRRGPHRRQLTPHRAPPTTTVRAGRRRRRAAGWTGERSEEHT